jgi:hypothetical protein
MAEQSVDLGDTSKGKDVESSKGDTETQDDEESGADSDVDEDDDEDEDEDEEDDEPKLKYARLTSNLGPVYRNGDATSAFLVAGDKMVCLNGYVAYYYKF